MAVHPRSPPRTVRPRSRRQSIADNPMANIQVELCGLSFRTPIIPAAGPNVGNGEQLRRAAIAGAGGLLAKTVSRTAAPVPRPHMYKFGTGGMLNAELWSELSCEQWLSTEYDSGIVAAREHGIPFIASLGYTADDLCELGPKIAAKGIAAIEFTVHYLDQAAIIQTARALRAAVSLPIIAKLSPHSGDLGELAAALEPHVDAFACINSLGPTLSIDIESAEPVLGSKYGYGWLSGAPLKPLAVRCVFEVARRVKKPVIGIGGICNGKDAIEMFMAGASLVGICTVVLYKGHRIYRTIAMQVNQWLDEHGYTDIAEIIGCYVKKYGHGQRIVTEKEESPQVIPEKCIKCGQCATVCCYDAVTAPVKQLAKINSQLCVQCGLCVSVCPVAALTFQARDKITRLPPVMLA
ncbi:MAG: 4Fe-4S binding protein [Cyanobacteria bacterium NC_groundwater_1444_Ag_S-0.65um_54_12]|nr:4Fe-4S binding protein [Cyanobacteria bacterium NC_groundwater_1444_Ag_S-0.65um_54_12]